MRKHFIAYYLENVDSLDIIKLWLPMICTSGLTALYVSSEEVSEWINQNNLGKVDISKKAVMGKNANSNHGHLQYNVKSKSPVGTNCMAYGFNLFVFLLAASEKKTLGNLETILDGYKNVKVVPSLLVFMGNFCS
ncbi:hypothetical protein CQW23_19612 [Capsicum baccatum]|uniref:Uncharacterized protein n=1 Tax=Capsicum baccatum TaxID=33114 RepID=A0A2G2W6C2_CAPBA|nr:hypothetical protein CQW23_19612 [Capsicum baccatum]